MTGQVLKIIFRQDKAYITSDRPLTFEQLNLPAIAKAFKDTAFWTINVLNYIENEKKIFCEIASYHIGETEFGENQKLLADKLNKVQIITFRSIDTTALLKTLAGKSGVLRPNRLIQTNETALEYSGFKSQRNRVIIKQQFYVPLKNVRFKTGGVSFDKKFNEHEKTFEITISNYDIREEFDSVKNYFANVLNTKRIHVNVNIEITNEEVTLIEAKSPEIEKINNKLIENVKFDFLKSTIKKKIIVEIDKNLFTMDEYFDTFADKKFKSNTFHSNEKELFEDLLAISNTKHYKQLRFLSSKHSHDLMKLRFVHRPFSFIFLIKGNRNFHFVWETLDTNEATYVWHVNKDINILKMTLRKIEEIINVIKVQGKTAYINSNEDQVRRIYHDYSDLKDGFVKWKGEIESFLT